VTSQFNQGIFRARADGASQPQALTGSENNQVPRSFTPDGKRLAYYEVVGKPQIWTVPLEDQGGQLKAGTPEPFLKSTFNDQAPSFSPDGRWLAYLSDESGRNERIAHRDAVRRQDHRDRVDDSRARRATRTEKDGRIKILDFGLAAQIESPNGGLTYAPTGIAQTDPGTVLGTVGYMAPEQARGQKADHRSDIFSLGCVLHEMLTGSRAFLRETTAETLTAILREDPPPLSQVTPPLPMALERVVLHCLEKRPEDRFQSARDLAFHLSSVSSPSSVDAPQVSGVVKPRRMWLVGVIGAAALVAIAGVSAWGGKAFEKRDGTVEQRLNALYNEMKHIESRIENGQMSSGSTVPVWLENEGLRSVDTTLTFAETAEVLKELAKYATAVMDPATARQRLGTGDA
jgi:serine/threonine protein kinase